MPYGSKSDEDIKKIVIHGIDELIKLNCEIIILACNTATTVALNELKKDFKNIFGVTPPLYEAVKDKHTNILLIATPATIRSLEKQIKNYDNVIIPEPLDDLASMIENNYRNFEIIKPYIINILKKHPDIDSIIIGCTHYIYIKKLLSEIKPELMIYDGNDNMIKQINTFFKESKHDFNYLNKSNITIIDSQKDLFLKKSNYIKIMRIILNMGISANIELL
jgi:glutamate racemase